MEKLVSRSFYVQMPDGSTKQIKKYGKTVAEAEAARDKAKWEYENGLLVFNSKTPAIKYLKEWIALNRKGASFIDCEDRVKRHFESVLEGVRMGEIKPTHCKKILSFVEGSSQSNIDKTWSMLKGFLQSAVGDGLINKSPLQDVKKPKGTKGSYKPLNETEKKAFLDELERASKRDNFRDTLIFALSYGCGLRPGEARAMTWSNVDLGNSPTMEVTHAVEKDSQVLGPPKTEAGYRIIPIPDYLANYLRQYRKQCLKNSMPLLLFPTAQDKQKPLNERVYRTKWEVMLNNIERANGAKLYRNRIIATAGLLRHNLCPYDLRHTYCTNLAEAGVDVRTAQYLMGHNDIRVTVNIYTTITDKMKMDAIAKVNAAHDKKNSKDNGRKYKIKRHA